MAAAAGPAPHRVIVTSRHTLAGLAARLLDITVLDVDIGVALLGATLRTARPKDNLISNDPAAARQVVRVCGELPQALQSTAALLTAEPAVTGGELEDEFTDEISRLEALGTPDGDGTSAPSVTAASNCPTGNFRSQPSDCSGCCRSIPGPDLSTTATAALASNSERERAPATDTERRSQAPNQHYKSATPCTFAG